MNWKPPTPHRVRQRGRKAIMISRLTTAFLVCLTAMTGHAASGSITLRDLAISALQTDETIQQSESQIRRTQANMKLARSVLLPSLELNGATTWYQEEASIELSPGDSFVIRPSNDWSWSADVQQVVFSGLRDWRARDVAKLERDRALIDRHTTANDLILEVASLYLTALAGAEQVQVAASNLEQIESQLKVAERRYEVGETAIADVARWRSERAAAYQRLVVAEGDAALALRRLERWTGFGEIEELSPIGRIPVPKGDDPDLRDQALGQRLEMKALANQLEAAGLWIKIEKGNWLPQVDAHLQYFQQKAAFPTSNWASASITAKVPIYDGGRTAAQVASAKEDLFEVELLARRTGKLIGDQVDTAAIGYRAADAADQAASERVQAAREAYRQVDRAYRVGEASATDLLATTADQTDAETAAIIAHARREYEAIALRHAIGMPPLPDLDPMTIIAPDTTTKSEE